MPSLSLYVTNRLPYKLFTPHLRAQSECLRISTEMVYHWDDKETECYRLYVEEKRSLDEVIAYWEARGFTPRYISITVLRPPK
jgi:hypothetical protein